MKCKNSLKKIIHSVCLISVLFLSVFFVLPLVESYAEDYVVVYLYNPTDYGYDYTSTAGNGSIGPHATVELHFALGSTNNSIRVKYGSGGAYYLTNPLNFELSSSPQNVPVYSPSSFPVTMTIQTSHTTSFLYYRFSVEDATPSPEPSTPTPDPSTPTPAPATPTPAPATPTPDANAEAFFGKLGSDAQNGVGAIMTAWNAANSHFYTSVLFIVLPVFLGIVSLIASFFFGGGDDD